MCFCGGCPNETCERGLDELNQRVKHELQIMSWPGKEWVRPVPKVAEGERVYEVLIVGGGQCGLATAYGLIKDSVRNVLCLDENEPGKEGPWMTYARMVTLRTPKHLTGLDLGMPSLTFQSYYEARFGSEAWAQLDKIPKETWSQYLQWYRQVLDIPVRNGVKVDLIEPLEGEGEGEEEAQAGRPASGHTLFRVHVSGVSTGAKETLVTRKVVLATGIQGGGEWHVPEVVAASVPRALFAHTCEAIDFRALRGKRVAVLGGGASAFDNAQHALGQGVGEVHVFVRRQELPRVNPIRFMEQAGFMKHFADLDDATKYAGIDFFLKFNQPPTNDTFNRACAYPNFRLHLGSPWEKLEAAEGQEGQQQVRVHTPQGDQGLFDFLIVSTGLLTDAKLRPELRLMAQHIATWGDAFEAPKGQQRNRLLDDHPYLAPDFSFKEKVPGCAPYLRGIFAFNYSALASLGLSASALSGLKYSLPKMLTGITRQIFVEDSPAIVGDFLAYDTEEFVGAWPSPVARHHHAEPAEPTACNGCTVTKADTTTTTTTTTSGKALNNAASCPKGGRACSGSGAARPAPEAQHACC